MSATGKPVTKYGKGAESRKQRTESQSHHFTNPAFLASVSYTNNLHIFITKVCASSSNTCVNNKVGIVNIQRFKWLHFRLAW